MPKAVDNGVLFLSAKDLLNDGTINYTDDVKMISEEDFLRLSRKALPQKGDIIYSRIGACLGKARVVMQDIKFLVSYSCCTIRPIFIDSVFLAFILDGGFVLSQAKKETQSVGVPDLGINNIKQFLIPIPSAEEQLRIYARLQSILPIIKSLSENKENLKICIDSIKSKILDLAIQGKLVPQDENDEPASVLLERIRAEKKVKLGKKYVESYIYKGDDNCYYEKVGNKVKNINDEISFDIPNNWCFIRLKEIIKLISGVSYDKRDIGATDIRILRGGNVGNLIITKQQDDVFLPDKYFDDEKQVKFGDTVVVASTGSKVAIGRAGFIEETFPKTQIGAFLRIIRPIKIEFFSYMKCIFSTDYYREHIRKLVHGNTINNIKSEYIEEFVVPLPPIQEQQRIAMQVNKLMSILKDEI